MIAEEEKGQFEGYKRQSENRRSCVNASIAGGSPDPAQLDCPRVCWLGEDPVALYREKKRSDEIANKRCDYHNQMYRGRAAVLKVLSSICQSQDEQSERLAKLLTAEGVNDFLRRQQEQFEHRRQESQQREQTLRAMLNDMSSELLKQVGSLNADYSSRLKEQENWRQKVSSKLCRTLIVSELIQLSVWVMLWLLLR